jgi:hypothetical protein
MNEVETVEQASHTVLAEALDPFGNRLRRRVEKVSRAGAGLNPPSTTLRTIASRPLGVKGAFLWTFIWSLLGTLKLRNLSFLGSDQMDNRLRDHT